jgi:hypothetical protein
MRIDSVQADKLYALVLEHGCAMSIVMGRWARVSGTLCPSWQGSQG